MKHPQTMLVPTNVLQAYVLLLIGPLICWSRWPWLRNICGLPMNAFVCVNVATQLMASLAWGLLLAPSDVYIHDLSVVLGQLNFHTAAYILGGFLLVHVDHLTSVAMQRLPASHAYFVYAGFTMSMGTLLNEFEEPVKQPALLAVGVCLVQLAIGCLAIRVVRVDEDTVEATKELLVEPEPSTLIEASDASREEGEYQLQPEPPSSAPMGRMSIDRRSLIGVGLCVAGGFSAMGWSPLATFASQSIRPSNGSLPYGWVPLSEHPSTSLANPFVMLTLFVGGEFLGIPVLIAMGSYLEQISLFAAFQRASFRRFTAGIAAGLAINLGYLCYFLATSLGPDVLPSTTVFALSACNPVVSLLAHEAWHLRSSRHTCDLQTVLTLASIACYFAAISVLVM